MPESAALMETRDVVKLLGVSEKTVRKLAADGTLRATRLGPRGRWRFPRASVEQIVSGQSTRTTGMEGTTDA